MKSQTTGEHITYGAVVISGVKGNERYSRLVCSPAWGMGRDYPPAPTSTPMLPCDGKMCNGRLYPFYYRQGRAGDQLLCYDCWQTVLLARRRELDAWYEEPAEEDSSVSGAAIQALSAANIEIVETELPPEDEASLRLEIRQFIAMQN